MKYYEIPNKIYKIWKEYAKAKAKYEMLSESRKSLLASLASKFDGSEATKDRLARSSNEFKEFLYWLQQARQYELELKYKLDSLTMHFEYFRSMNSLKKKEMELI